MIKLFIGAKGSGKTKTLIELVNNAVATSTGSVVCIEKGNKLNFDITHKARLVDADAYAIGDAQALYGFVAGIVASDHDITDLFIDSTLKICQGDVAAFTKLADEIAALTPELNVVMTASMAAEECGEGLKKYM